MQYPYKPLGNRVIVEPIKPEERTKGGIILSEQEKKTVLKGTVLEVSEEVKSVKKGEVVLFSSYNYEEIEEKVFSVEESNLLAVYEM